MRTRGFEVAKGWEDKGINLPKRSTKNAAGYDIEAAEDVVIEPFKNGMKPTLVATGLKAYCADDEWFMLANRSSGPKKGFLFPHSFGIIDSDYYENETNDGHFMVQVFNCSDHDLEIKKGTPIAQVMFTKYLIVDNDVAGGVRTGGFGSTDKK